MHPNTSTVTDYRIAFATFFLALLKTQWGRRYNMKTAIYGATMALLMIGTSGYAQAACSTSTPISQSQAQAIGLKALGAPAPLALPGSTNCDSDIAAGVASANAHSDAADAAQDAASALANTAQDDANAAANAAQDAAIADVQANVNYLDAHLHDHIYDLEDEFRKAQKELQDSIDDSTAIAAAMSAPVWLGDNERVRFSAGGGFTNNATAIGGQGVFRISGNVAGYAGGAVSTDNTKNWAGKAGVSIGW